MSLPTRYDPAMFPPAPAFPDEFTVNLETASSPVWATLVSLLSPLVVATIALVGVLWQAGRARKSQLDAEAARDRYSHANDLRSERRSVQIEALFATAETVRKLKALTIR
ncbi:hypothetical protein [Cellulosimicrobium sp. CUA-896]|uniref:hypothetical protein n=1 Tax=Cellulosimicrobium sp. CUA-896 TaxID=1517881 RepID=UPI00111522FB|nr:hypothetical protein [Cellulosimicrobium sp. CUA-896]